MNHNVKLSAIILTQNESTNIEYCLRALRRIDDVIVVDSGSTDGTLKKARLVREDVRIFHHEFQDFGNQRNWALDNTDPRYDWILFVDADEFCDPDLIEELSRVVRSGSTVVGGYIAGRNYFLGKWLKYSTMYPSYQLRLLKKGCVRFERAGHGQREVVRGEVMHLEHGWRHEGFSKGVDQWIERHNRYSTAEVEDMGMHQASGAQPGSDAKNPLPDRRQWSRLLRSTAIAPFLRFLYSYVWRGGFLDGYPGYLYCLLISSHHVHIQAKRAEMQYKARR